LRLARLLNPDYAFRWYTDLRRAIAGLANFPGPLAHARDEEASAYYGFEVRRMLYFGPGSRRSGTPYRVLFTILPPPPDEDETIIRVLRVLHGSQELAPPQSEPG
jgi:plasmid stabilization system protein ParE